MIIMDCQDSSQTLISELNRSKKKGEHEGLQYFSSLIGELGKHKTSFDSDSAHDLILKMSSFCYANYKTSVDEICATFIDKCGFQLIYHFIKDLSNKTLQSILKWFISFSDHSERFAIELESSMVLKFLVDMMLNSFHLFTSRYEETYKTFEMCVNILYNVSKNPYTRYQYRSKELKRLLVEFIKRDCDRNLAVLSMLTLSYIMKEKEIDLPNEGSNMIGKLIQKIKYINKKRIGFDDFTLDELLKGLHRISSNDKMRKSIEAEGGLPVLVKSLNKIDENEVKPILGVFENLCLNEKIKIKLVQDYNIEETLKRFESHPRKNVRKKVENLLCKIRERSTSKEEKEISNLKYDFDVFISYSWDDKERVSEIVDELRKYNFRIWIDKEQMKGISLKAMSNGIKKSELFLMIYSSSYEKSNDCYQEAQYAYRKQKTIIPVIVEFKFKPASWLEFIIGERIYHDFSGCRDPNVQMHKLIEEIRSNLEKEAFDTRELIQESSSANITEEDVKTVKIEENVEDRVECLEYLQKLSLN